ncbi:MAG: DUF2442 domain-containing protein [Candidatus Eremiobacteraeota bacterium]|nr:DUF2442 domain-containing protein [Candidatus Eremiobacteraeota bacterium]
MRRKSLFRTSDAEIDAAIVEGRLHALPRVVEAIYDAVPGEIVIRFENGVRMAFPRGLLQGLEAASPGELQDVVIAGPGTGLYWPKLDVGHYVRGLIGGVFGTRTWMQQLRNRGRKMKRPPKTAGPREDGRKGGRPRKTA